jgi:hypothetical protein
MTRTAFLRKLYPVIWAYAAYQTFDAIQRAASAVQHVPDKLHASLAFGITMMWRLGISFYAAFVGAVVGVIASFLVMFAIGFGILFTIWIYGQFVIDPKKTKAWEERVISNRWLVREIAFSPDFKVATMFFMPWLLSIICAIVLSMKFESTVPLDFGFGQLLVYVPGFGMLGLVVYLFPRVREQLEKAVRVASGKEPGAGVASQSSEASPAANRLTPYEFKTDRSGQLTYRGKERNVLREELRENGNTPFRIREGNHTNRSHRCRRFEVARGKN